MILSREYKKVKIYPKIWDKIWDTHLSEPAITRLASSLITHISPKNPLEIG